MRSTVSKIEQGRAWLERIAWLGPLLVRLSLGAMFAVAGWGKLNSLPQVTGFFQELGIPSPGFFAGLVATTEFVGGLALLFGLFTRLASIPLAITMVVAIATAKADDIDGFQSLLALSEFTYLAVLVWLIVAGPGAVSLDAWLLKLAREKNTTVRGAAASRAEPART